MPFVLPPPYGDPDFSTAQELFKVDGISLHTYAKSVETIGTRLSMPGMRQQNLVVPARSGTLYQPDKTYADGYFNLPMWLAGCDDDGSIPTGYDERSAFFRNHDALVALLGRNGLRHVEWHLPSGVRECYAERLDAVDFTTFGANPMAKFVAQFSIPDVFWQDVAPVTVTSPAGIVPPYDLALTGFAGATGDMEDLSYTILGPLTNPELYQADNGFFIRLIGALDLGDVMVVDSATWSVTVNGVSVVGDCVRSGKRLMVVPARYSGDPTVTLRGTLSGPTTQFSVSGRRKYLAA